MSHHITIQIQDTRATRSVQDIENLLHAVHAQPEKLSHVEVDWSRSSYCNVLIGADHPSKLWAELSKLIAGQDTFNWIRHHWIVAVEGKSGWNDYSIVAHFDPSVPLDIRR